MKKQTMEDRIKMRKAAQFSSVVTVEKETGIPKNRVDSFEKLGADNAGLRLLDAITLAKAYGVTVAELIGADVGEDVEGLTTRTPQRALSPLREAILRNCEKLNYLTFLLYRVSENFVKFEQDMGMGDGTSVDLSGYEQDLLSGLPHKEAAEKHGLIGGRPARRKIRKG